MYSATTHDITVTVRPAYLDHESMPDKNLYVWSYTVTIENRSAGTWQLKSRHWIITDALGREQHVRGAGVVGEEPLLQPGDSYTYTSGTPLQTAGGIMRGSYTMEGGGRSVDIEIPAFSLDVPRQRRTVN